MTKTSLARSRTPKTGSVSPHRCGRSAFEETKRLAQFEGLSRLGDDELLALSLQPGPRPLSFCRKLLEDYGGVGGLSRLGVRGLSAHRGVSLEQATWMMAAVELGRRAERCTSEPPSGLPLSSDEVARWALPRLGPLEHEEVWVLSVDSRTTLRSAFQVGRGGVHGCGLVPRDILTPIVRDAASGFVLIHNHPSGDPTPSREDLELTQAIEKAGLALGTPLLDHVIVSRGGFKSMFECGMLATR